VRSIRLPALRERTDFAHLVSRLVHAACGARAVHMHAQTIARLQRHTWPGNISELRSCLRLMLALLADEDTDLRPQDIPDEILDSSTG
jgi:transcriptional regulator of acetoin/glycerol metabolism